MYFKQVKHVGDNFSYVIAEDATSTAVVVDPSFNADSLIQLALADQLKIGYIVATHHHLDHVAGIPVLNSKFGSTRVAHKLSPLEKDVEVVDGDVLKVGELLLNVIHTPGHTPDSICLLVNGKLLTGDTLFVGECGRTDLPDGDASQMYTSLFQKILRLDDSIEVYPGHDYGPRPNSTIGIERRSNYTLEERSLEEFIDFMKLP